MNTEDKSQTYWLKFVLSFSVAFALGLAWIAMLYVLPEPFRTILKVVFLVAVILFSVISPNAMLGAVQLRRDREDDLLYTASFFAILLGLWIVYTMLEYRKLEKHSSRDSLIKAFKYRKQLLQEKA